ncbi:DNA translocase FtsK 4TM domain-containing protein [Paenibacillus thailandensis]|uniref:DNA translocase FtsK 4TM domain-containing protein n=1 Tax=Paenibacillus thailandensis TaxID=393250 RepID=A0ABW5QWU6_9BACL
MAKKRRRKKSIPGQLKYEVYGILLITISIIALSGEATVGRSLSKLCGLVLGKFYFALALVGVAVGLAVMVKRAWPRGWTQRRTGLVVLLLALTLMSSIAEVDRSVKPAVDQSGSELSGGLILEYLSDNLYSELIESDPDDTRSISEKAISGGYVGALQYSILYSLFGYFGAKLIMYVMVAISIMLLTGKSYVELIRLARDKSVRLFKLLKAKWDSRSSLRSATAVQGGKTAVQPDADAIDDIDDDEGEVYVKPPRAKKSLFFSWRTPEPAGQEAPYDPQDDWSLEETRDESQTEPRWIADASRQPWVKTADDIVPAEHREDQEAEPDIMPWEAQMSAIRSSLKNNAGSSYGEAVHPHDSGTNPTAEAIDPEEEELWRDESEEEVHTEQDWQDHADPEPDDTALERDPVWQEEDDEPESAVQSLAAVPEDEEGGLHVNPEAQQTAKPQPKPYVLPPMTLLTKPRLNGRNGDKADTLDSKRKLEATLESFGVRAKVLDVVPGPAVTRYEVQPATGVKVSRIVSLTDDIALALAAKDIRMEAPIPGKSAIGIEVPNGEVSVVTMREVMETPEFMNAPSKLSIAFGKDIAGTPIVGNLAKMPHLLVAGATGSGKSVCINGIITSILYKAKPDEVKFLMIDPKMVELNMYNGIPHLLAPVVTNPRRASLALKKIVVEMEKRYELFSKSGTRNIEGYNTLMIDNPSAVLPYIVVIVDELADLMMVAAGDVEDSIARLAQMARAAGIHLIIATQRPSVDVITGVIKANIPSRIAFGVSSAVDSRTILDTGGAEKLLGRGDMLYLPVGMSKPIRVQGAFLSDPEVEAVVTFASKQAEAEFKEDLVPELEEEAEGSSEEQLDELFDQAVQIVVDAKQASVSLLQRRMRIGYTRAARLIDQMEARGIVGPYEGSKPREVLVSGDHNAGPLSS